jgi:CSLREA domain-containing protein
MEGERVMKRPSPSPAVVRLGLALALLGLASWSLPIHASPTASITVTTSADELNSDGDCSLREAIQAANTDAAVDACPAGSGADTITFDAAIDGTPIVLTGAASEDANASGDLDILDGGDLTIQGNGAGSTIVDGGGIDRVFHVCPGGRCANTVTLNGVTVRNGRPYGFAFGGGIYNAGATLNVESSVIGDPHAGNRAAGGGGIGNQTGTTVVDDTAIVANTAVLGGGILNYGGWLTVQNGSMVGQLGAGNSAASGGGIDNWEGGVVTVDGSSVISNTADNRGGGIYNRATLTVTNGSVIRGNMAFGTEWDQGGGGIYNDDAATMTMTGSSVISNTARSSGGGIENEGGTVTVHDSIVSANAADRGGGIYNWAGTLRVDGSSVISNTAATSGGGISVDNGTATVGGSSVSANTANHGGGIYNDTGTLNVRNGSLIGVTGAGNKADYFGGGIYNREGTTTVDASGVISNTADWVGGGIYNHYGTLTVSNGGTVNRNTSEYGGGISSRGTTILEGSTISGNKADCGGGILNEAGATTVTGSRILNNMATTSGGGVLNHVDVARATRVTGSCIVGNSDASFFNDEPAQQIATFNWWGAATGPNSPGADTVGGNVDTSGYLTAPILGCAAELQVSKTNDAGGETTAGTPFHWTLTISNTGMMDAVFGTGQEILVDDLSAGPAYGAPTVADLVTVTGGANIDCGIAGSLLTCEAGGEGVTVEAGGSFAVGFSVTADDAGTLTNPAGICRVDPDGNVTEGDENNDCPTDTVNVEVALRSIYLPLVVRNAGAP